MKNFFARLQPFLLFGVMLVILLFGLIVLSYVLIYGAIIGLVLFAIAWIKEKLMPSKKSLERRPTRIGRTFEHDDKHEP